MQIIKWQPFRDVARGSFSNIPSLIEDVDMASDIFEEDDKVVTKISLPGVEEKNLDISLTDDTLIVSGYREEEVEASKKDYYNKEIRRGSFSRLISLPRKIDPSKAKAHYENGFLSVVMPIIQGSKKQSVRVQIV